MQNKLDNSVHVWAAKNFDLKSIKTFIASVQESLWTQI